MKVLGIDASLTATGLCLLDLESLNNRKPKTKTLTTELIDMERMLFIENEVKELAADVDLVIIENYAFDAKYNREKLAELQGIIKRRLYLMNKRVLLIDTHKAKKVLTGNSTNPTDLEVKKWILNATKERFNIDFKNKDGDCDSFGLAVVGLCTFYKDNLNVLKFDQIILDDIKEVLTKLEEQKNKVKIKKNLSYYFSLPFFITCTFENDIYKTYIPDLDVFGEGNTIKKSLAALEKNKRLKIRELRKNKVRIKLTKSKSGKVAYNSKRNQC